MKLEFCTFVADRTVAPRMAEVNARCHADPGLLEEIESSGLPITPAAYYPASQRTLATTGKEPVGGEEYGKG
jgi:hypothetical protein